MKTLASIAIFLCLSLLASAQSFDSNDYERFYQDGDDIWRIDVGSVQYKGQSVFFWSMMQKPSQGVVMLFSTELSCKTQRSRFWRTVATNVLSGEVHRDGRRTEWFNKDGISIAMARQVCKSSGRVDTRGVPTPQDRNEFFKKEIARAKWTLVVTNEGQPFYVDWLTMNRLMSTVTFVVKTEKRGTTIFSKVVGGCTKDLFSVSNTLQQNPGMKEFVGGEIENPEMLTVSKGTPEFSMLDYVCKNAKVMDIK